METSTETTTAQRKSFGEVLRTEPLVLVDFYTEWCGPCKLMKPILQELKQKVGDSALILKIDVDKNPAVADTYGIRGVPTLILFSKGEIVWQQAGVVQASQLQRLIEQYQE